MQSTKCCIHTKQYSTIQEHDTIQYNMIHFEQDVATSQTKCKRPNAMPKMVYP